ncbi:MAG: hypothetical protein COV70_03505 [Parcubacteria group bacterium CG11_big_fil_rev_8_21_14_0_20_39_22]|nr:MAG: hypothetical protein COV70_03505 [Parcubacteria group bacterium CG11_big_fil_rev_8_21_14_0_20_39_22]
MKEPAQCDVSPLKYRSRPTVILYVLSFFFSLHYTLSIHISSSFLATLIPERLVGSVYIIGSLINIAIFFGIARILRRASDYRTTMWFIFATLLSLFVLAFSEDVLLLLFAFIVNMVSVPIIYFNLDVLLENYSTDKDTGRVRGIYLTMGNIAWVIAPLLTALLLVGTDRYQVIYLSAFLLLIPSAYLLHSRFRFFKDPPYGEVSFLNTFKSLITNKNVRYVSMASFLLQFFFAWMTIYIPIYLHSHVGFSWSEIGVMLSIALLPYVLFEEPLGKLADTKWGEKEILTLGFFIIAISTIAIAFVQTANFLVWAGLLFLTRTGASMIEIMSETYFFKVVDGKDIDIMAFFRIVRPAAYVIGPLFATLLLLFIDFSEMFLILGLIMLVGIHYSLGINDTR